MSTTATPQPWKDKNLFCHDLPTEPRPEVGTVLVTGACGYIGGRLVPELLARGYRVRVMVRGTSPKCTWPEAEMAVADALDYESLKEALNGVSVAYYLIHSMLLGTREFARADIRAAENFRRAAEEMNVGRIIYLGGLGDVRSKLSQHLRSRMEVARELARGKTPVTILRAAVIIGSGSASYEIIKHIVLKLPIIPIPGFARNLCQPIAVRDVIKYLVGVLENPETAGRTFDIGGDEIMTYGRMVRIVAELLRRRRLFVPFLFSNIRLYAYIAGLLTPVPDQITRALMEGLRNDVSCQDDSIRRQIPFETISYRTSIVRAMTREEQDRVHTRWSDAYPPAHELALKLNELAGAPKYMAAYSIIAGKDESALFRSLCRIGGAEGWFRGNWMWRMRGAFDRLIGGVGTSRGRRQLSGLYVDDVVDFWRVEDLEENRRLLLRSEMRLPGKTWLEFRIKPEGTANRLFVKAYYHSTGLFGRLYWYIFLPFHRYIFKGLIRQIAERS
ncbi:MAG TPA: SDR family oxidoreductase [Patescibacteria group bacterium]|nr:SDR family oxidoreductase [Patescibacteria group bacterium]